MIDLLNYLVENGYAATLENARIICEDDEIYPDFFTMMGSSSRGSTTSIPQFISISMSCKNSKMLLRRKLCDYGESDVR